MLAAVDPALLDRVRFPLGEQTKEETRAEAACAGLAAAARPRARRRASSPATTTATSSSARASRRRMDAIVDREGARVGRHDGHWRFTPGQRRGLRRRRRACRCTSCVPSRPTNTVVVGPRDELAVTSIDARGRLYLPVRGRGEAAPSLGARRRERVGDARRLLARARGARIRRRAWPVRGAVRRGRRRGRRRDHGRFLNRATRILRDDRARDLRRRHPRLRPRRVLRRERPRARVHAHPHGRDVRAALVVRQGHRARLPAGHRQGGRNGRPGQRPARQARRRDGQRRVDGGQRGHGRPRGLDGDHDAGEEGERPRGRRLARLLGVPRAPRRG